MLIHPGFHKTGTTLLQQGIFSDTRHFRMLWSHETTDALVVRPHDIEFTPVPIRDHVQSFLAGTQPDCMDVLSSEILSGNPLLGARDSAAIARRLKAVFGQAKILLTIRAQPTMLASLYMQYLKAGGTRHFEAFYDPTQIPGYFGFDPDHLRYSRLASLYADLFSAENVLVLPQELLARDPIEFLSTVWKHAFNPGKPVPEFNIPGRRIGKSPPPTAAPFYRLANNFWSRSLKPDRLFNAPVLAKTIIAAGTRQRFLFKQEGKRLEQFIDERFRGYFAMSNRLVQQFCPVDLHSYGYELAE